MHEIGRPLLGGHNSISRGGFPCVLAQSSLANRHSGIGMSEKLTCSYRMRSNVYCWVNNSIVKIELFSTCRFKFPSVFIIFQTITVSVYAVFILIGYTDKETLFCSSDDVVESMNSSTPFCTIIGRNILYYFVLESVKSNSIWQFSWFRCWKICLTEICTELLPHSC